ncbi:hypothetical protein CJF34_22665, partial [Pseudomonas lundensis]
LVRLCRARTRVNFRDKPVQGAGEERGWRLAQRVGILKALRGAPPEGLGVPQGRPRSPAGMTALCCWFVLFLLLAVVLLVLWLGLLQRQ